MTNRIYKLGAIVTRTPLPHELPDLVSRITRLWAELHTADPDLAAELAQRLPDTEITVRLTP